MKTQNTTFKSTNPRTGESTAKKFQDATKKIIDDAVLQAKKSYSQIAALSNHRIAEFLRTLSNSIEEQEEELVHI